MSRKVKYTDIENRFIHGFSGRVVGGRLTRNGDEGFFEAIGRALEQDCG